MSESFLLLCKQSFIEGITPSNTLSKNKEIYKRIVLAAKEYFDKNKYNEFMGYFMEGQYFISLWAAHMLIENGNPDKRLISVAFNTIKEYADNPIAPDVAREEAEWLKGNAEKYKEYL